MPSPKKALKRYSNKLEKLRMQIKSYGAAGLTGAAVSEPLINRMSDSEIALPAGATQKNHVVCLYFSWNY